MILVTGGTGLLGKTLSKYLNSDDIVWLGSKDADLRDANITKDLFEFYKPSTVIHLAAKVGGILSNVKHQYDYYIDNVRINTNVIDECIRNQSNIIAISSSCVYPAKARKYPLTENQVHESMPEPTNISYAYTKRMMDIQLKAANENYGLKSVILYLGNLYGIDDHYNDTGSHLVPALIYKFHNAKINNEEVVELYGDGTPLRQFTLSDDVAKVIDKFITNYIPGSYNVSCPENLSVKQIAEIVAEVVGYKGNLKFNGKYNGVNRKDVDCSKLLEYHDINFTSLKDGVKLVYDKVKDSVLCGN
ncbi:MAG: NAD-dependent epimerase/dehydratase family protein [Proteobacteria bacterium]|nr:NAD-dependent epimerase/dehydratase family protein [Pseudomonadota bacterium]